jgi:hypothetical protein
MADFSIWSRENLVNFCVQASIMIADKEAELQFLREDLKAAIAAYREINRIEGKI